MLQFIVTTVNIIRDIQSQNHPASRLTPHLIVTPQNPEVKGVVSVTRFHTHSLLNPLSYLPLSAHTRHLIIAPVDVYLIKSISPCCR